ncbi:MAG: FadR family transcriptional regulator [Planctomycetaceae bacterium]|nr:FadR family transcriptional regulator [Planctomycetaceae bacterium]
MHVKSASDRVSEITLQLERLILSGDLAVGDYLPAERALSEQLGVSRSVIREALGRLTSIGLTESRHGSGTRVATPSGREISVGYERLLRNSDVPLEDLAVVRLSLESTIASLAASHRTDPQLQQLAATQAVLVNPRKSLAAHVKADAEFHAVLAEATGNRVFPLMLTPIHDLLTDSRLKTLKRYGAALAYSHHQKIFEAVRSRDASAAAAAMREHLAVNSRHLEAMAAARSKTD